ncbi:hypothetical protein [Methanomethylovorans sp.]|uniref:hypothetical protein n=1 Tax=Methanomethylovorans sp. TaxID=2758717 RepID=UPI00351C96EC
MPKSKSYCGFHLASSSLMAAYKNELSSYGIPTMTIRFSIDKTFPWELAEKLGEFHQASTKGILWMLQQVFKGPG